MRPRQLSFSDDLPTGCQTNMKAAAVTLPQPQQYRCLPTTASTLPKPAQRYAPPVNQVVQRELLLAESTAGRLNMPAVPAACSRILPSQFNTLTKLPITKHPTRLSRKGKIPASILGIGSEYGARLELRGLWGIKAVVSVVASWASQAGRESQCVRNVTNKCRNKCRCGIEPFFPA